VGTGVIPINVGNWVVKVPLDTGSSISIIAVPVGTTFRIIGMAATGIVSVAKGSKVEVGMGLPGVLPV
jgi:hypothetical protein